MAIAIIAGLAIFVVVLANIIDRELLGSSILGAEEFSRFAFLWVIWMGVSLAVRRSAVTVLTHWDRSRAVVVAEPVCVGWRCRAWRSCLTYASWQSAHYVFAPESVDAISPAMRVHMWIAVLSMPVGYVFILIQYGYIASQALDRVRTFGARPVAGAADRRRGRGRVGGRAVGRLLRPPECRRRTADPTGDRVRRLTLSGMPVVFMLSLVGILGATSILSD